MTLRERASYNNLTITLRSYCMQAKTKKAKAEATRSFESTDDDMIEVKNVILKLNNEIYTLSGCSCISI